jgi:hypothetical protein
MRHQLAIYLHDHHPRTVHPPKPKVKSLDKIRRSEELIAVRPRRVNDPAMEEASSLCLFRRLEAL